MEELKNSVSRVVGTKQVLRGLKSGTLAKVYVANDADTFLYQRIAAQLQELAGVEARAVIPGHIQRGGSPSAYDRVLSTQFGVHAAELIRDGIFGVSVALVGNTITHNPLSEIAGVPKLVPPDHQMIQIARNIGISFGAK